MKTIAQINWITAIITAIIIASFIAYILRNRCKEIIYLFSILAALVTIFCFSPVVLLVRIVIPVCYLVFAFVCLFFDSMKTPGDSLMHKDFREHDDEPPEDDIIKRLPGRMNVVEIDYTIDWEHGIW